MNQFAIGALVIVLVLGGGFFLYNGGAKAPTLADSEFATGVRPATGSYTVVATESTISWSAQKPLIEGYINSGTIEVSKGTMTIEETTASGSFSMDMNTLDVGLTAKKPGSEGKLEEHLKGERFFDVATYPSATFEITSVTARSDSDTTATYDIQGNLTMKGKTNVVAFPAKIFLADGTLHAEASLEIDRTKWGITAGSGNFFEGLGDNLIDDMVALSFVIIAEPAN